MYVVTFYSFKGGVGRSMALVNVAVDLVKRGRRVLIVDFDLEAPGLDTFKLQNTEASTPGLTDYVTEYRATGQAPRVEDYVSRLHKPDDGEGCLWLMPSGHPDNYAHKYGSIDWAELYEQEDGYLMFEDLKAQWASALKLDYVLIDSRTGHTDVGGICTRHLPDAVVVLFFPNAQNLRGLSQVVRGIKSEAESPRSKEIDLHYVMSNVPDLDDEDSILERILAEFKKVFELHEDPLVVHHYHSMALLNQSVFVHERPRSRLAREYRNVAKEIMRLNAEDRDGAIEFILSSTRHEWSRYPIDEQLASWKSTREHIEKIDKKHHADGEVLFHLAEWHDNDYEAREALLSRAIEAGYRKPIVYLKRALVRRNRGNKNGARDDAIHVLETTESSRMAEHATSFLSSADLRKFLQHPRQDALTLDMRVHIASIRLNRSYEDLKVAYKIMQNAFDGNSVSQSTANANMILVCIGLGKFDEALDVIRQRETQVEEMGVSNAFNYGMALWGHMGTIERAPFQRVVDRDAIDMKSDDSTEPGHRFAAMADANYLQCMAIAHWAVGDRDRAEKAARYAIEELRLRRRSAFSCWRYRQVSVEDFVRDTEAILGMVAGNGTVPTFMEQTART